MLFDKTDQLAIVAGVPRTWRSGSAVAAVRNF
jgi:hypothetical protein